MTRWQRWVPLSGLLFVVSFIVLILLVGDGPGDSDGEILAYYAKHSNRVQDLVAFFVFFAGLLMFLWFVSDLAARLRRVEGEPAGLSRLVLGSGLVTATLFMVANALFAAPSATVAESDEFRLDPNTARMFGNTGYLIFISAVMTAIVLVWATSVAVFRTGVLPRWFAWAGLVAGLTFVFAIVFVPVFVLLAWVLVASLLLAWREWQARRIERPVSASP